jgi:hypothetical protein
MAGVNRTGGGAPFALARPAMQPPLWPATGTPLPPAYPTPLEDMTDTLARATSTQTPGARPAEPNLVNPVEGNDTAAPMGERLAFITPSGSTAPVEMEPNAPHPTAPVRNINSKRVTLNYEVKDAGPSGVSGVDLYCTRDQKTWRKLDAVPHHANAYVIEMKEEGRYGFTLLARSGAGLGKDPPRPGDQPQVWVNVDVTPPSVAFAGAELTGSVKSPNLVIRWTAKDKNFGPRPITLRYAEQPSGPWTPIAAGLENTGCYEWPMGAKAPHHFFVRVEATDLMGNSAVAQTPGPLAFETSWPAAAPSPPVTEAASAAPGPSILPPSVNTTQVPPTDLARPTVVITAVEPTPH